MKIAYHFDALDKRLGGYYGLPIRRAVFKAIIKSRIMDLHTKIFQGDILLKSQTCDSKRVGSIETHIFNADRFLAAILNLLNPGPPIWKTITQKGLDCLINGEVFVILFESISFRDAQELDEELRKKKWYLGCIQIDDTCPVHWAAYAGALVASYRIVGHKINLFWDGFCEDSKDHAHLEELVNSGFSSANFESLNGRYTIFDQYTDFEQARRVAELNAALSDSLGTMADQVMTRLSDTAPELGNKLWSAIRAFERAEVPEDYAQVATSCRRVIEYISDSIFPPLKTQEGDRKLGAQNYRNRLLAFADKERRSDTNLDLICAATSLLAEQLEKLESMVNKGVHAEIYKHEARRCLLRTIMSLDDLLSLKNSSFNIKPKLDFTFLTKS